MKKLILLVLFLLGGIITPAQTWQSDTLRYFKNYSDTTKRQKPDTMSVDDIIINVENGKLKITKTNAELNGVIKDTLPIDMITREVYIRNFDVKVFSTVNGRFYDMEMHMMYFRNDMISFALSRGKQIFIYSIVGKLDEL